MSVQGFQQDGTVLWFHMKFLKSSSLIYFSPLPLQTEPKQPFINKPDLFKGILSRAGGTKITVTEILLRSPS